MRRILPLLLLLLLCLGLVQAHAQEDIMGRMAEESEIKAIAQVRSVRALTPYADGTLNQVTFKLVYAVSSYTPKQFFGGCRSMDSRWQTRAKDTIYFAPKPGEKVFVTVTSDNGAITSYTPLTPELEKAIREAPNSLYFKHGKAYIRPGE